VTRVDWDEEDGVLVRDLRLRDFEVAFAFVGMIVAWSAPTAPPHA
jgi:hypothetical protein